MTAVDETRIREIVREELALVGSRSFALFRGADRPVVAERSAFGLGVPEEHTLWASHDLQELLRQFVIGVGSLIVLVEEFNRNRGVAPEARNQLFVANNSEEEPQTLRESLERGHLQRRKNLHTDAVDSGGLGPEAQDQSCHNKTPYVARAVTRYVTGAILAASRWLQRKAWVRRLSAARTAQPSDTTSEEVSS